MNCSPRRQSERRINDPLSRQLPQTTFPTQKTRHCILRRTKSKMAPANIGARRLRRLPTARRTGTNRTRWPGRFDGSCAKSNPSPWPLAPARRRSPPNKRCDVTGRIYRTRRIQPARTMRKRQQLRPGASRISLGVSAKQNFAANGLCRLWPSERPGGPGHVGKLF